MFGGSVEGDGGKDDVWDVVGCVDHLDGACEGGEVCDFDVGEESVPRKRIVSTYLLPRLPNKCAIFFSFLGMTHSASN